MNKLLLIALLALGPLVTNTAYGQCEADFELFELIKAKDSGIRFANTLREDEDMNFMSTTFFFNGGGVAIGDIDNDGLQDLFFTGNMQSSVLYKNLGQFKFKDITRDSGIKKDYNQWATGVNMVDINSDGWLDIYICYTHKTEPKARRNKFYINQGDGSFEDQAAEMKLDDPGYGVQSAFFDFDKDGDLDMYLLNYNADHIPASQWEYIRKERDPYAGDKLFRNDDGVFTDVSEASGIKGNPLGYGLGVAVSDVNDDMWPDIYVSNDFIEPDYLYINNGDGTFTDQMTNYFQHVSHFSMGSDIQDINNDLKPDVFSLDMLPEDNKRQKLLYGPDNYEQYARAVISGFYHQNMRNMMHLNNGNGSFSEIGQLAGVSNTDWSWSSLFADFDNDGWKDLFVTNGYAKDVTDRDFLKFRGDYYFNQQLKKSPVDTMHIVNNTKSTPIRNYLYRNNADLTFTDMSECWGIREKGFSNGAAYGDLDNDGDLDLVTNNINEKAHVYKNTAVQKSKNGYLSLHLDAKDAIRYNSKVTVYINGSNQLYELMPMRGFQSRVSDRIHIGVGNSQKIDSILVRWSNHTSSKLVNIPVNQTISVQPDVEGFEQLDTQPIIPLLTPNPNLLSHRHEEYGTNDFKRQPLLLTMKSNSGPVLGSGDLNGDGLDDLVIGSSKRTATRVLLQSSDGKFQDSSISDDTNMSSDSDVLLLDCDNDGDLDLFVGSGGYHDYLPKDPYMRDRLFLNNGDGKFEKTELPEFMVPTGSLSSADIDSDGDMDVFVGGSTIPGNFPTYSDSYFLINNGACRFDRMELNVDPQSLGIVNDSKLIDLTSDGFPDLVVLAEYQPIRILVNKGGKSFEDKTSSWLPDSPSGIWSGLLIDDFDKDGDFDLVAGNFGLNSQIRASKEEPITLTYADFDSNGSVDPILTSSRNGIDIPFASRDDIINQVIKLRKKFTSYDVFSEASLTDILSSEELESASQLQVTELRTLYLENTGDKFKSRALPVQAQFSPVFGAVAHDFNDDGHLDILLGGNQSFIRIRLGLMDANYGCILLGDGTGNFQYLPQKVSGLDVRGDVKSIERVDVGGKLQLIFGVNNDAIKIYEKR